MRIAAVRQVIVFEPMYDSYAGMAQQVTWACRRAATCAQPTGFSHAQAAELVLHRVAAGSSGKRVAPHAAARALSGCHALTRAPHAGGRQAGGGAAAAARLVHAGAAAGGVVLRQDQVHPRQHAAQPDGQGGRQRRYCVCARCTCWARVCTLLFALLSALSRVLASSAQHVHHARSCIPGCHRRHCCRRNAAAAVVAAADVAAAARSSRAPSCSSSQTCACGTTRTR